MFQLDFLHKRKKRNSTYEKSCFTLLYQ